MRPGVCALDVNVQRGVQSDMRALTHGLDKASVLNVQDISPDGSWFFCGAHHISAAAVRRDGTVLQEWPLSATVSEGRITPDGLGWVEVCSCAGAPTLSTATLAEPSLRRLPVAPEIGTRIIGFAANGKVLTHNAPWTNAVKTVELSEVSLRDGTGMKKQAVIFPEPVLIREVVLSADKQRLGWIVLHKAKPSPLPFFTMGTRDLLDSGERTEIWVSGADGSGLVQIADESPLIREGEPVTDHPHGLRWLPSGKQLSFFYRRALYLIPSMEGRDTQSNEPANPKGCIAAERAG